MRSVRIEVDPAEIDALMIRNGWASLMNEKAKKPRISGKDATYVAIEAQKYAPVQIRESDNSTPTNEGKDGPQVPAQTGGTPDGGSPRTKQCQDSFRRGWVTGDLSHMRASKL
jgi:hypothetical protein